MTSLNNDLANAVAALATANDRLRTAQARASSARGEETEATNAANEAQKSFDALVTMVKKTAPPGTDWTRKKD